MEHDLGPIPVLADPFNGWAAIWGMSVTPSALVLDRQNRLRQRYSGVTAPQLRRLLRSPAPRPATPGERDDSVEARSDPGKEEHAHATAI